MKVITVDNVNGALTAAVSLMRADPTAWREIAPRGKTTMEYYEPVATVYRRPWRRVLFSRTRDANPFFHLMEALWMMHGRRDAAWLTEFSSKIGQYAEDDGNFHGAYGRRWRSHFHEPTSTCYQDQLFRVAAMLRADPDTRRAVLAMWDASIDLGVQKRDIPCNTHIYFKIRDGRLQMTVCCRSNDLILGCYGANAVHFSVLQAWMASAVGVSIGEYTQISDSWHYYVDNPYAKDLMSNGNGHEQELDYYVQGRRHIAAMEVVNTSASTWLGDLRMFMRGPIVAGSEYLTDWRDTTQYEDIFFKQVAVPMRDAWQNYQREELTTAISIAESIAAPDWKIACVEWLERRLAKRLGEPQISGQEGVRP